MVLKESDKSLLDKFKAESKFYWFEVGQFCLTGGFRSVYVINCHPVRLVRRITHESVVFDVQNLWSNPFIQGKLNKHFLRIEKALKEESGPVYKKEKWIKEAVSFSQWESLKRLNVVIPVKNKIEASLLISIYSISNGKLKFRGDREFLLDPTERSGVSENTFRRFYRRNSFVFKKNSEERNEYLKKESCKYMVNDILKNKKDVLDSY